MWNHSITAEGRTLTEPANNEGGFHVYAATALCRCYFGFANGEGFVWIHMSPDATLPGTAHISTKVNETEGSNEAMLNTTDSVRSTRTQDGRILLDVRHGQMFSLNVVGSKILELIEQGWDEARIGEEISRTYATTIEVARADVHEFIEALRKHSILQANGSGDSI